MLIMLGRDTGGRRGGPPAETFWVAKCSMKQKERRSPHDDPDVQLMLRFQNGEEGAFQQLFNKHASSVVNFAFRFLGNRARAEEIAQDVFLQVYRWQERYEPKAKFSTWLFKIANNHCLNEVRKGEYRVSIDTLDQPYDGEDEAPTRALPDQEGWPGDELLAAKETADRIKDILSRIPDTQRTALLLSRLEGLSYQEVAGVLGCTEKAVKSLVFRATQSLRVGLKDILNTS